MAVVSHSGVGVMSKGMDRRRDEERARPRLKKAAKGKG
jgi:hypothetical protein